MDRLLRGTQAKKRRLMFVKLNQGGKSNRIRQNQFLGDHQPTENLIISQDLVLSNKATERGFLKK